MRVKYVEFLYPGTLFSESSLEKRNTYSPDNIKIPKSAFGFRFCERVESTVDGEVVCGTMKYEEGIYYAPGATIYSLKDVKAGKIGGDVSILISDMECNGYATVVKTNRGNIQPFGTNDSLITK